MFDWDKYAYKLTWNEMYEVSPFFDFNRLPSMINSDENMVYLSSLDLDFSLTDTDNLSKMAVDIQSILDHAIEDGNYYKAAMAQTDLNIIERYTV